MKISKRIFLQAFNNKLLFVLVVVPFVTFAMTIVFTLPESMIVVIGVIDEDQTELSAAFMRMIDENESFRIRNEIADTDEMLESLRNREIAIGMKINKGFYDNLGTEGVVELFQTQDIQTFMLVELYLNGSIDNLVFLKRATENEAMLTEAFNHHIEYESIAFNLVENEAIRGVFSTTAFGFLTMFMLLLSVLSSKLIVEDRFSLTIIRIFLAPISKLSYVAAGILTNLVFQLLQVGIVVLISQIFGFSFFISLLDVFILFAVFAVFSSFFGLFIGFSSANVTQMIITSQLFILPGTLLCGTFFDFNIMPSWLQSAAFIFPQTWLTQAVHNLGNGYFDVYFIRMFGVYLLFCIVITGYLLALFKTKKVAKFY